MCVICHLSSPHVCRWGPGAREVGIPLRSLLLPQRLRAAAPHLQRPGSASGLPGPARLGSAERRDTAEHPPLPLRCRQPAPERTAAGWGKKPPGTVGSLPSWAPARRSGGGGAAPGPCYLRGAGLAAVASPAAAERGRGRAGSRHSRALTCAPPPPPASSAAGPHQLPPPHGAGGRGVPGGRAPAAGPHGASEEQWRAPPGWAVTAPRRRAWRLFGRPPPIFALMVSPAGAPWAAGEGGEGMAGDGGGAE